MNGSKNLHLGDLSHLDVNVAHTSFFANLVLGYDTVEGILKSTSPHLRRDSDFIRWVQVPLGTAKVVLEIENDSKVEWTFPPGPAWYLTDLATHLGPVRVHDPFFHFEKRSDDYILFSESFFRQSAGNCSPTLRFFDSNGSEIDTPTRRCVGFYQMKALHEMIKTSIHECQVSLVHRDVSANIETQAGESRTLRGVDGIASLI